MLKWWIVSTSCILASLVCSPAQAAEDTTRAFELEVEGAPGVWFPMDMAREMQADVEKLRKLKPVFDSQKLQLEVRKERLDIKDARILQLREALELSMQAEERTKGVVEAAVRGQRRAEEVLDAWYRSPAFLMSMGAGAVILVEVGAILIFTQVSK